MCHCDKHQQSKKSKMLLLSLRSLRHERLFSVPCGKVNGADIYRMNRVKVRSGRIPREGYFVVVVVLFCLFF